MKKNSLKLWALALTLALFNATHAEPLIEGSIFKNNDMICLIGDSITHSKLGV